MKRKLQLKKTVIRALTKKDVNGAVAIRNCDTRACPPTKYTCAPNFTCVATVCTPCAV